MKYAIIKNDAIFCDPIEYDKARFSDMLNRLGCFVDMPDDLQEAMGLGTVKVLPGIHVTSQPPNAQLYTGSLTAWGIDGNTVERHIEWTANSIDDSKVNLKEKVSEIRFNKEVAGITLGTGATIKTDRESQAQLTSALNSLKNGLITQTDWKASDQWVTVTVETIMPIAQAVASHVTNCFTAEKEVSAQIDACTTFDALLALDLTAVFETSLSAI